jgi:hypothetical protein
LRRPCLSFDRRIRRLSAVFVFALDAAVLAVAQVRAGAHESATKGFSMAGTFHPASFRTLRHLSRRPLIPLLALGLAACGGPVGSGNGPETLVITLPSAAATETSGLASLRMYECLTSSLKSTLFFQDGSSGNFTSRVKWSSSDPGTVEISNGDIEVPGQSGSYYAAGTLVPVKSGSAIVTADYDGIEAQIAVSIGTPQSIKVKIAREDNYVVPDNNSFTLGVGTTKRLQVTAWLDGVETDIGDYANWSFQTPNSSEAAIVATSGIITAIGANTQALVPVASFPPCSLTNITDPANAIGFTVQHIQSIAISPEFSGNPALIVGNAERMFVLATLDDGTRQDISGQATLSSSNTSVAGFGSGSGYTLTAEAAGPTVVGATFTGGGVTYTAPSITVTAASATLQTITICWTELFASFSGCPSSEATPTATAGSLTPVQFHAVGTYDQGTLTQEITRQTSWSSSDSSIATIGSNGQALGVTAQGSVTITGTDSSAQNVTSDKLQLLVQ